MVSLCGHMNIQVTVTHNQRNVCHMKADPHRDLANLNPISVSIIASPVAHTSCASLVSLCPVLA